MSNTSNSNLLFLIDLASGTFGGCSGILAGHPLDTIKVRLQTQIPGKNIGIVSCFKGIVKQEGFVGLYKGMAAPMVGVAIVNSLLFAVYGSALRICAVNPESPTIKDVFFAGSMSGFVNAFFSTPMELIKIRLQNQTNTRCEGKSKLYSGPIDCIKKIIKKDGFQGLFRGLPTTIIREVPSYGAYFATYEIFCKIIPNLDPNNPSFGLLTAGGFAGVVGWMATYPVDVIKTRLQSIQEDQKPKYLNMRNAFKVILREEGYRVFFSGLGVTALRAWPTNAATFFTVVSVRNALESSFGISD